MRISSQRQAEKRQRQQSGNFRRSENILDQRSGFQSKNIYYRQKDDQQHRDQILGVDADIHISQNHGADANRRDFPEMQQPARRRNCRKENSKEFAESHAHRGNRAGLDHQKKSPAVEKAPQGPERFAEINVLAAGMRHHRGQFAIAERGDNGHEAGDKPGPDQESGRIDFAGNLRRNNKDAGADHRAHDQHRGTGQAQAFDQFLILMTFDFPVANRGGLRCRCAQEPSSKPAHGVPYGHRLVRVELTLPQDAKKFLC